jgi:exosortase/archaeosortase family protein
MEKNLKTFIRKSIIFIFLILAVMFFFKFPIDLFNLALLKNDTTNRLFSKSDALKILSLAVLFFTMYFKERISKIGHEKPKLAQQAICFFTGLVLVSAYYLLRYLGNLYEIKEGIFLFFISMGSLIALVHAFAFFSVSVFSFDYLKRFYSSFKKELWVTALLCVIAYNLLMLVQGQWYLFSNSITILLFNMFNPFFPSAYSLEGDVPLLQVNDFLVAIGAPCSGIESMFLFAAFAIGIFALDCKRMRKVAFLVSAVLGLIGIYFVNLIRLFLLMLVGIYINPEFAVGMFHTNVGWLLFVIYFLCYYLIIKTFIYLPGTHKGKIKK